SATCGWWIVGTRRPSTRPRRPWRSILAPPRRTGPWPTSRAPAATSRRRAATWRPSRGWPPEPTRPGRYARRWHAAPPNAELVPALLQPCGQQGQLLGEVLHLGGQARDDHRVVHGDREQEQHRAQQERVQ